MSVSPGLILRAQTTFDAMSHEKYSIIMHKYLAKNKAGINIMTFGDLRNVKRATVDELKKNIANVGYGEYVNTDEELIAFTFACMARAAKNSRLS